MTSPATPLLGERLLGERLLDERRMRSGKAFTGESAPTGHSMSATEQV
jgi:hypothetical protein